ncbi:MAG: hypothetical protein PHF51_05170 [Candidatus ainarchaeum sp.]|nr:hypothetical protein [Candidatus ainarchaeum sp.]
MGAEKTPEKSPEAELPCLPRRFAVLALIVLGVIVFLLVLRQAVYDSPAADAICGAIKSEATPAPGPKPAPSQSCPSDSFDPTGLDRWCNSTGCYWGILPTPVPDVREGDCAPSLVPAELRWQVYNPCYCAIRVKYDLGPYFSLSQACNEFPRRQWAAESCECLRRLVEGG